MVNDVAYDAAGSATVTITPALTVSITPTSASVRLNRTRQFTANTSVVWKVNGVTGGNSTSGTITANGLYRAPSCPFASQRGGHRRQHR